MEAPGIVAAMAEERRLWAERDEMQLTIRVLERRLSAAITDDARAQVSAELAKANEAATAINAEWAAAWNLAKDGLTGFLTGLGIDPIRARAIL